MYVLHTHTEIPQNITMVKDGKDPRQDKISIEFHTSTIVKKKKKMENPSLEGTVYCPFSFKFTHQVTSKKICTGQIQSSK
jgi:hypothetical protein